MSAFPLFLHLLADRRGAPTALLFDCAPGLDADSLRLALASAGDDAAQAAPALPRFFPAALDAALAAPLSEDGWQALDEAALQRLDDTFDAAALAPATRWLAGRWWLAPQPRTKGGPAAGGNGASRALALQLVQKVAADADTHEIEALLRRDPTLSYHLLRLVNSLGMGAARRITSFSQALLILGRQQLRRWLNLMLFAAASDDPRAQMLLARTAFRACALEALTRLLGGDKAAQEGAFMCGMFSLLGVLFGTPLAEVLRALMISETVSAALLQGEDGGGELGALLALLQAAEQGNLDAVAARLAALQIDAGDFNRIVVSASDWMLGVLRESGAHA
jgi:EAL and modified HD-GYP domain-containing signal transduction protein